MAIAAVLVAEDPVELGPFPTREMFPLAQASAVYQPIDPTPLGVGRWRATFNHVRGNTFEFSDILKSQAPRDVSGRVFLTREFVLAHAAEYATIPLIFYFDEEVVRSTVRVRRGITEHTDLWAEIPFQTHSGGKLDGVIEGFHSLGFEQYGRDRVGKYQLVMVVMAYGKLLFYNDESIRGKTQDPTLGITHQFAKGEAWNLSAYASVKPPLTSTYAVYRSGWDQTYGVTGRWQPLARHVLYFGGAFVRRPKGNVAYTTMTLGGPRDGLGAHAAWEYRRSARWRPFFQLYYQTGLLKPQIYQKLDRPSLQHDLGLHWTVRRNATLSFHYMNNITHNENTADMSLGLSLDMRF
ncbi:MAG: DUF3187 family protein [Holophaga sp.]|nr:DUF3187 family protein [Holophaga sp.]